MAAYTYTLNITFESQQPPDDPHCPKECPLEDLRDPWEDAWACLATGDRLMVDHVDGRFRCKRCPLRVATGAAERIISPDPCRYHGETCVPAKCRFATAEERVAAADRPPVETPLGEQLDGGAEEGL